MTTQRPWLWVTIALGALTAVVAVGQALLLSRVIAQVFLGGADLADVQALLLGLVALALLRAALSWAGEMTGQRLASLVKQALRERVLTHLVALGPTFVRGERSGELANTTLGGVEALDEYLSQYLPQVTLAALMPLIVLVFVLPFDPLSGLVLMLTAPLIPLFLWLIGSLAKELTARQWADMSRMSAHFLDTLQGLTTLKLFGRSRERLQEVATISAQFGDVTMQVLRIAFLSAFALELIASLSTAIIAVEIGLRLLYGRMAFEPALTILILAPEFYLPLRLLGQRHHAGMAGKEALGRIEAILATPVAVPPSPMRQAPPTHGDLELKGVSFAYDHGARPVLHQFDLRIPAGQTVALVGPSGVGKSSVAALLMGFVQPDEGSISVGGVPLTEVDLGAWRQQVAWVSQHPALFYGSVAENLRLARPDASDEALEVAARAAGAHAFITALPQGYATPIGEGGTRLSGGQRQRLALARALLKDAPFVILDEPTSHLDPASELEIRTALRELLRGRTALIITHSASLLAEVDHVVQLEPLGDKETMVAQGSPSAMLREAPR
ncbi:thiol reductant ABC exporter subunit CydD [Candidatus Chloroploca sp. M-50]|uniref:Thiol reductant ABC exporter subunit CydD n=1 Tax=Candidatus Chloroploca mongolica TaxID=2528176 RepID=A0ABS4D741_9CHLR|nr:thiol reductant ABC exporter subunit CydD [Candidatus Chloroploca mongolica]MBP1465249.1 thiol reductant ABC exporter subunit CydD [Candidatus Chloroploca mongolica]